MRIVSWNMNYCMRSATARQQAWDYLRNELHADLALVQEAVPPPDVQSEYRQTHEHRAYRWGTAVVAFRPDLRLRAHRWIPLADCIMKPPAAGHLPESHPGACAVADVLDASDRCLFTAVSLYGQWECSPGGKRMYACTRVQRVLSDLTGVLATSARQPVVLAGDFNLTTQGAKQARYRAAAGAATAVFARLAGWGLVDCLKQTRLSSTPKVAGCTCDEGDACAHVATFRTKHQQPYGGFVQLDYAFASKRLAASLGACEAVRDEAAWALSDHCPLVVDLDETKV